MEVVAMQNEHSGNYYNKLDYNSASEVKRSNELFCRHDDDITSVVFDMDGLMFDTERVYVEAWDYAGSKIGIGKAGYLVYKTLGMNSRATQKVLDEEFPDGYDKTGLAYYTKIFLEKYYLENGLQVKAGLYELLSFLKDNHYKIAVASSTTEQGVRKNLSDAKITEYFQVIIGGDMVSHSKPDPEIYMKACKMLEENPENCLALEDSKNGLLSAYNAGCKPIMVPDLWQPDEKIEKILYAKFTNLSEVIGLLRLEMKKRYTK